MWITRDKDEDMNKDVVVQDYKLYNQHACYNGHEKILCFGLFDKDGIVTIKSKEPIKSLNCKNSVEIEIKQNKEDMEENYKAEDTLLTRLVGRYVNNLIDYETFEKAVKELYSDKKDSKPTLKEFDLEALNKFNLSGVSVDEFIKQQESYLRLKQIKNNNEMNEKEFDATSGIPQDVYEAAVNEVLFGKPELPKASDYILSYEGFRDLCAKYIQEHLDKEVLAKEGVITIHMPIGQYAYRQNYPERLRNELVGLGWDEELTRVDYFTTTEHPDCLHITLGIFNQHRKHD